ncbi:hypothetical protein SKAU_G00229480 [Synaphobranchus kaupii]|uniref:Uncharacterized protein n=1 Tax=Synaphobranchus kaupii TaxID=118154 RepID=A0A9Q1F5B3_SYNKA|nr:hypothetical protein SKAU_G00229480 [Synaphobranchus kaupii]
MQGGYGARSLTRNAQSSGRRGRNVNGPARSCPECISRPVSNRREDSAATLRQLDGDASADSVNSTLVRRWGSPPDYFSPARTGHRRGINTSAVQSYRPADMHSSARSWDMTICRKNSGREARRCYTGGEIGEARPRDASLRPEVTQRYPSPGDVQCVW